MGSCSYPAPRKNILTHEEKEAIRHAVRSLFLEMNRHVSDSILVFEGPEGSLMFTLTIEGPIHPCWKKRPIAFTLTTEWPMMFTLKIKMVQTSVLSLIKFAVS